RIEADAAELHAFFDELLGHLRQLVHPRAAHLGPLARLRDDDVGAVTLPSAPNELAERKAPRIIVRERRPLAAELPLIRPVVVDADDVERLRASAELRLEAAAHEIPELRDGVLVE